MVGKELKDLLMKLLDKKRQTRLGHQGAQSVKSHPWFSGINWESILKKTIKPLFVPALKSEEDVCCFEREFTEFEALSPPDLTNHSSYGSDQDKTYKGFTYQRRSSNSKSAGSGGSVGSHGEVSIPSASPP
jgi:hypothetical protein